MRHAIWALVAVAVLVGCGADVEGVDYSPPVTNEMPTNLRGESFSYTMPNDDKVPCILFSNNSTYINVVCDWTRMYR